MCMEARIGPKSGPFGVRAGGPPPTGLSTLTLRHDPICTRRRPPGRLSRQCPHHPGFPSPSTSRSTTRADAPMVVLVHGSLDRSASFARVLPAARRPPHRGLRPPRLPPLAPRAPAQHDPRADMSTTCWRSSTVAPAVVVGHSYGGDIALGAALREPTASVHRGRRRLRTPDAMARGLGTGRPGPRPDAVPATAGDPIDPEAAAAAAERFFRRMVGDAAWDRLPESAKVDRRADGPALAAELGAIRTDRGAVRRGAR